MDSPTGSEPTRSAAELERLLADRDRRLRDLTDQALGLLDQLTESRQQGRGRQQELQRECDQLRSLLNQARTVRRRVATTVVGGTSPRTVDAVFWSRSTPWNHDASRALAEQLGAEAMAFFGPDQTLEGLPEAADTRPFPTDAPTPAALWNEAMASTEAEWVWFVSDVCGPGDGKAKLIATEDVGVAAPTLETGDDRTIGAVDHGRFDISPAPASDTPTLALPDSRCFAIQRAAFETVGPFDQGLSTGLALVDWQLRAASAGYRVLAIQDAVVQVPASADTVDHERDRLLLTARHAPSELGHVLAELDLFWERRGDELRDLLLGAMQRVPNSDASILQGLAADWLTAAAQRTVPSPGFADELRLTFETLHQSLTHRIDHLPVELRDPHQRLANPRPDGKEPVVDLAQRCVAMAQAVAQARSVIGDRYDEFRQGNESLTQEVQALRQDLGAAQQGAKDAQHAHDNAVRSIEHHKKLVAERDALLAQRNEQLAQRDEQLAQLEQHAGQREQQLAQRDQQIAKVQNELESTRSALVESEERNEVHVAELQSIAEAIRLTGSTSVGKVTHRLEEMRTDLGKMAEALHLAGEPDPQSLVQSLIQLRGIVKSRNQWIAALLEEIGRPRLSPFPRSLAEHEVEFIKTQRPEDNGSSS